MKIYIFTDIEGVGCVGLWSQTREPSDVNKAAAMRLLTGELNAVADGILDEAPGAEIQAFDGHGILGIDALELHPAISLFMGRGRDLDYGLSREHDAVFFVGQHAMANTPGAPLCHTYSSREIVSYRLNGLLIGEFGCRAYLAGSLGVPTVFLSGDDKACLEAKALVAGIETVETKKGIGDSGLWSLHPSPAVVRPLLRAGAARAIRRIGSIQPAVLNPPYELEIETADSKMPEFLAGIASRVEIQEIHSCCWRLRSDTLDHFPI